MIALAASLAVTVTLVEPAPLTLEDPSAIAIFATTPPKVSITEFACPAIIAWLALPEERILPVAPAASYSATEKVSLPTGAGTIPWHVVVHAKTTGVRAVPPVGVTVICADFVAVEMYCGTFPMLAGIEMLN